MAEKFCSEFGGGPHQLKIGKSFEKKGGSAAFHQIRYDFTPLSVDEDRMGKLEVQENNAVSVSLPHNNGVDATNYKGQAKPSTTKDCVLIIDHETGELTLERLSNQILLKKTRPEKHQPGDSVSQYQVRAEPEKPVMNPYTVKREPDKPRMSSSRTNTPSSSSRHKKQSPAAESGTVSPARAASTAQSAGHTRGLSESSDSNSSSSSDTDTDSDTAASFNEQSCQLAAAMEASSTAAGSFSMPGDVSDLFLPGGNTGQLPTSRPQKQKKSDKVASSKPKVVAPGGSESGAGSMPTIFTDLGDDLQLTDESDD